MLKRHLSHLVVALALVASATPALAQQGAAKKITTVEGITEYQLPNGLRVLLFPDSSKPTVTVNITYLVGSRHEGYGETGMAHLLEHMVFKGTPKHKDIWALLQEHGAEFNGTTWYDRTNYYETLPATDENLKFAITLEADRMVNSLIAKEELAKEFSVVRNEFEMGENNPKGVLSERMWSTAFLWHNYGKSTIGSRADIEKVPADSLRAFYTRFYQPDNAVLVVAGKFDPDKTLKLINDTFGKIARPKRVLTPSYTVEPVQDGERTVILRRNGDVKVVAVLFHTVPGAHEEYVSSAALVHALTDDPSGRLYKALVESGLATKVSGSTMPLADPGIIEIAVEVAADKPLVPARDKLLAILDGVASGKTPITEEEVARYRAAFTKGFELAMTSSGQIGVELSEYTAQGDWRLLFVTRDRAEKVNAAGVNKVAATYLKKTNRTIGMFVPTKTPERAPLPAQPDVASLVKDYKGREAASAGEEFDATVANIEKRTTRGKLASGLKFAFLPKKTRGGVVLLSMTIRYGTDQDLKGKQAAAELVPEMLMRGTKTKTFQQLKDQLDKLKAEVSFGGGGMMGEVGSTTVNVETVREHLPAVIALVAEMLQEPAFPASELEVIRKEAIGELEQSLQDPMQQAIMTLVRRMFPAPADDVRYIPTTPEEIARMKAVKLADLVAFHKDYYAASNAEVAIVGEFDAAALQATLEKHFGSWKSTRPFVRVARKYTAVKTVRDEVNTPDKEMALLGVAHPIEMRDDDADYPALTLVNFVLGGSMSSRLLARLRQKEGISYAAFSALQAGSQDKVGIFLAGAIAAPQNVDKAMAALREEIAKMVKDGVSGEELEKAKKSYKNEFDNRLANDSYLLGQLRTGLFIGRTFDFEQKLLDAVMKLTPAQLAAVLKKGYIHTTDGVIEVVAGDMAKAKAAPAPTPAAPVAPQK
jgi:zinc protease